LPYEDRELEEKVVIETKSSIKLVSYRKKRIPIGSSSVSVKKKKGQIHM